MKTLPKFLSILAILAFAFFPILIHAQDQPPPPPMDNGVPPPPDNSGAPPPPDASGGDNSGASFQEFYDQLGSQGQWIQTDNYGYAFQPTVTDPNWAPYTEGHWAYTDVGWTWVSDEPWGWATYHYGRWVNIDGTGWAWVPGYTWAPAWVSWRYGGGYCGWAPLPPATMVGVDFAEPGVNIGIGFYFGSDCDEHYDIGPGCYNFIRVDDIGEPYYRGRYLDRSRNFVVINNTRNITNIRYYSGRPVFGGVTAGGPALADVNAHARTHIEQVRLAAAGQAGRSTVADGTLNVYAPRFNPATVRQARPGRIDRTLSSVKVNRGTSISHPLAVNASLQPAAPSEAAIRAAREAQANAPRTAHIATAKTVPTTALNKPLTSLQPATELRQTRATDNRQLNQENVQAQKQANQDRVQQQEQTNEQLRQEHQQQGEANQQSNQQRALEDKQANQDRVQQEQQSNQSAAEERAAKLQQEQAAHQQNGQAEEQARQERAAAAQERAATEQRATTQERAATEERAPAAQQHAPVAQQRAAAAQHAAPASAAADGNKAKNQNNQ